MQDGGWREEANQGASATWARLLLVASYLVVCPGCATLGYYAQSVSGQMEVLSKRRPIAEVLEDPAAGQSLKEALRRVRGITEFAHEHLLLPDNGSYENYADLGRPHVAWNVFAAPELSLEPVRWCFLVAGCLSYRGYFDRADADAYAGVLAARGFDVYVAAVAGYSTLGWFADPVLDSMLRRSEADLARLLFHELAHQKLYLDGDTELNEAFADAVALIGVQEWEKAYPERVDPAFRDNLAVETAFVDLVLAYRELLRGVYESAHDGDAKRAAKQTLFAALRTDYETWKRRTGESGAYDEWFSAGVNNARLAALSTYRELVPLFLRAYRDTDNNIELFYARIRSLETCDRHARVRWLRDGPLPAAC